MVLVPCDWVRPLVLAIRWGMCLGFRAYRYVVGSQALQCRAMGPQWDANHSMRTAMITGMPGAIVLIA